MAFSFGKFYSNNRRAMIWAVFFLLLWMLRRFFSLIFLTFVFAFLAAPLRKMVQKYLRFGRRVSIILVYLLFLTVLGSFVTFIVPQVIREIGAMTNNLPDLESRLLSLKADLVRRYPPADRAIFDYLTAHIKEGGHDNTAAEQHAADFTKQMADLRHGMGFEENDPILRGETKNIPPDKLAKFHEYESKRDELLVTTFLAQQFDAVRARVPDIINAIWVVSVTLLLALFFSFIISMDIYRLGDELRGLKESRLGDFYDQTAYPVWRFAYVIGRAIYAQALIACANTVLTIIGLVILGIPSLIMLSFVVFLCSFIPVLGVFMSTAPIVAVALNSGGMTPAVGAVVMVIMIHAMEAYVLDPWVYGQHFKLNPVLVLIILFFGDQFFGVWGMILGVPVTYYFLHDVFGVKVWDERRLSPVEGAPRSLAAMVRTPEANPSDEAPSHATVLASGQADAALVSETKPASMPSMPPLGPS